MNKIISLVFAVFLLVAHSSINAQDEAESTGLYLAMATNSDAWETGNVLVKITTEFESLREDADGKPTGVVIVEEKFLRTIFDYKKRRFAQYGVERKNVTNYNVGMDSPLEIVTWNGHIVDFEKQVGWNLYPHMNQPKTLENNQLSEGFLVMGFRDYRSLPFSGEEGGDTQSKYSNIAKGAEAYGNSNGQTREEDDKVINLRYTSPRNIDVVDEGTGEKIHISKAFAVVTFDKATLMVIKRKNGDLIGKVLPVETTYSENRYQWIDKDGIFVPRTYFFRNNERVTVGTKEEVGVKTTRMTFHWFGFNQDLDESFLDGTHLKNRESVLNVVLPEKAGATTLIDKKSNDKDQ